MSATEGIARRRLIKAAAAVALTSQAYLYAPRSAFAQKVARLKVGITPPNSEVTLGYQTASTGTGPLQPMFEFLTMSDRFTGEVKPCLASEWQPSADAKDWRFKLRSDVNFHDGTPFTAKDVVLSWQFVSGPDSRATTATTFRSLIKSAQDIELVNDHEIVFHLAKPEPELTYYLAEDGNFFIYSKDYFDKVGVNGYAAAPIGTGPFKFKEFKQGQYILYDRVENHWRQTPEFAELQLLYMPEDSTRLAALLAGEVHIAEIPSGVQNQAVARGKKIVASTRPAAIVAANFGGNFLHPKSGTTNTYLTNKLVRQAMNLAVNRDEINQQIFGGRGTIAATLAFQPTDPEFDPAWKPYPYDPDKAKQLLAQAGFGSGFDFNMTVVSPAGFPEVPTVIEALANYFTAIGLRPNLVQMEMTDQINHQRAADFYNMLYTSRYPVRPPWRGLEYFWSQSIYHFFEDPFLEGQVDRFSKSVDPTERAKILHDVGNFLYDSYTALPIVWLNVEVAVDPTVVSDYQANMAGFGASVGHEYTKAVM